MSVIFEKRFNKPGNIVISDQFNNRVVEVNVRGEIVWSYGLGPNNFTSDSIIGVNDAERIGDKTLMAGTGIPPATIPEAPAGVVDNRVIIVDRYGKIVWQYGQFGQTGSGFDLLNVPVQSTFVPLRREKNCCYNQSYDKDNFCKKYKNHPFVLNGTVLITDQANNRVIEVNQAKQIVWQYTNLNNPNSAEKLENGNVLIADQGNNRAIEVNLAGQIVRTYTAGGTISICAFASRLDNGNTLLTDRLKYM